MTTTRKSNFAAGLRTTILMAALGGLLVAIGYAIGGVRGATVFLAIALVMNFVSYWFSDKIALASAGAKPISESEAPRLYQIVRELTTRAGLPMPRLYMIPRTSRTPSRPGATRSTPRSPSPAGSPSCSPRTSCAACSPTSSRHVRNRDILTQSVASAIGAAIT